MEKSLGILDMEVLERKMALKGISSISELSSIAGIHRNSLLPYVKGERSIYASVFERICQTLDVFPAELIKAKQVLDRHGLFPILSNLWSFEKYSNIACFLFGSRAKGAEKKFSDYDIGISGGINPVDAFAFLEIKESILQKIDDLPVSVDIVDFDNTPEWFIAEVDDNFKLICGDEIAYQQLIGKIYGIKKARKSN